MPERNTISTPDVLSSTVEMDPSIDTGTEAATWERATPEALRIDPGIVEVDAQRHCHEILLFHGVGREHPARGVDDGESMCSDRKVGDRIALGDGDVDGVGPSPAHGRGPSIHGSRSIADTIRPAPTSMSGGWRSRPETPRISWLVVIVLPLMTTWRTLNNDECSVNTAAVSNNADRTARRQLPAGAALPLG